MNSTQTLGTLKAKRAAVALWVDAHENDPGDVYTAHVALWVRLDDAIEYLEARVGAQRLFSAA